MVAELAKTAFQQTEVGEIPSDWEVILGSDLSEKITKGASPRWQGFSYQDYGVLFVTSENVRDGHLDVSEPKYLPFSFTEKHKNSQLQNGDLLINIVGASIGRSCVYNLDAPANINQAVCLFRPSIKVNHSYLLHFFQSQNTIKKLIGSQTESARPNLSLTDIRTFKIALPPTKTEQTAIATALTDADALITQLEKLIAKKKAIKQGAMQELLKPKEGWVEKTLGDIAVVRDGTHQTPKYFKQGIPFYSVENVTANDFVNTKFISLKEHAFLTNNWKIERGVMAQ